MSDPKVRREIALRAAQLMYAREESEYYTAKRKAAKQIVGSDRLRDLPSNREIREQIQVFADLIEGDSRRRDLRSMRLLALYFLRMLVRWKPRLIGSVLTGHVRKGSDIDLHVFCDTPSSVAQLVEHEGYACKMERKRVLKHHEERVFTHIHVEARHSVELTVYGSDKANYPFRSSITGTTMERADSLALEAILRRDEPGIDLEAELSSFENAGTLGSDPDVWGLYDSLLRPLEHVRQSAAYHPEGDALFHSLQVFTLAREVRGYDQEFLLAALLHDCGKAIDPGDHVGAAVGALDGAVSERTLWLIEHHMIAHAYREGSLGGRARRRLADHELFEDVMLLSELDKAGRVPGMVVPTVEEVIEFLRAME